MISKKTINFLKSVLLPISLYLILFNPLYNEQDQNINITVGTALLSIFITLSELAIFIFLAKKVHKMPFKETGVYSFMPKTLLQLIPSLLVIWGIYFAGILIIFLLTGSADDPGIITVEFHAPLWLLALMMLGVGYCEEFFFRVYMVDTVGSVLGKKVAVIISALFFALGHLYQGYLAVAFIFFIALGFQWIYEKYKSIHVNAMTHAIFDVISVMVKVG